MKRKIAIAGAGFAGAILARQLVESGKYAAVVYDTRDHVAGNCHSPRDPKTGIMIHQYGPHIFNTSRDDVWEYVNRYSKFGPYVNRVKATTSQGVFSLPINLLTINQFFKKTMNPREAQEYIASLGRKDIQEPKNLEEQALKFLGDDLYYAFFYGYTKKQWGVEPRQLPASILKRLPIRFNYDDNYFNQKYQGIPVEGYTRIVEKILDHTDIEICLSTPFKPEQKEDYFHVFYSGPMDSWFNYKLGRLQYRTLSFERFDSDGDFQGNAVMNYCEEQVSFTRIAEHKHFTPWEEHQKTVYFKEFSKLTQEGDTPYYPLRLAGDKRLLEQYIALAHQESGVTFIGRLGTYRYLDMHIVIGDSLDLAKKILGVNPGLERWPSFGTDAAEFQNSSVVPHVQVAA